MFKTVAYAANHTFQFRLAQPFTVRGGYEVDTIRVEVQWADAYEFAGDSEPEGWMVYGDFYGWPLTKAGKRDKRIKERERLYIVSGAPFSAASGLWEQVSGAWTEALHRSRVDAAEVINPGEGLFDPANWK